MAAIEAALDEAGFVGTYLHGSLAAGAYHPPKSDVDLLFVVDRPLSPAHRERVSLLCVDAAAGRPTLGTLELSVLRREATVAGRFSMPYELHFGENLVEPILAGTMDYGAVRTDDDLAAHIRCLHETGVGLSGPDIDDVFAPVPEAVFRASVEADQAWILEGDHILESPFYAVLNLCRGLWLQRRPDQTTTPSKVEAGRWALEELPAGLRRVVGDALAAHQDSAWVPAGHRRTAGRVWDVEALIAFRDSMAVMLGRGHPAPPPE